MKKMSLLDQHGRNEVKDDLIADLVSGQISRHFEAIRKYTRVNQILQNLHGFLLLTPPVFFLT